MWILIPLEVQGPGTGAGHFLLPGKDYVVGRKSCEVLLPNDQSISRVHAVLSGSDECLTVKDRSKYGTFVNEERLTGDAARKLKAGDRLTFGVFNSKFRIDQQEIQVCSSCLDTDGKTSLSQTLLPLGGRMVNTWTPDCTHLVMPSVKVTIKTICALLCCRPIVKQSYFSELVKAIQQKQELPKVERFYPDIDEPSLKKDAVDLREKPERRRLFTGKTFIFLSSKQMKRLSSAVTFGGGRSHLLEEGQLPEPLLGSPWSCVVDMATGNSQAVSPSTRKWADSVGQILKKEGLRFITESEIGLAAIYASCDKYCNPSNDIRDSDSMLVSCVVPGASLSQNTAVNETMLPAASQNITAYVANTETSQRMDLSGVTAVGETPERNQSWGPKRTRPSSSRDQTVTSYMVGETMMSSSPATENAGVVKMSSTEAEAPGKGKRTVSKFVAPPPLAGASPKVSPQKGSHQKPNPLLQGSPHKQSSLTNFFQSVNKKRPLEEGFPAESEPKRSALLPCDITQAKTRPQMTSRPTSTTPSMAPSMAPSVAPSTTLSMAPPVSSMAPPVSSMAPPVSSMAPPVSSMAPPVSSMAPPVSSMAPPVSSMAPPVSSMAPPVSSQGSGADMFPSKCLSDRVSSPAQQGQQSRKRKEEDELCKRSTAGGMEIDELESIMSEEMLDFEDEQISSLEQSSANRKQPQETVKHTSTNKKQRLQVEEHVTPSQRVTPEPVEGSSANRFKSSLTTLTSANQIQMAHQESHQSTNQTSSLAPQKDFSANTNQRAEVKDEEVSFVEDGAAHPRGAELHTCPEAPAVKQEVLRADMDDLPRRLLQVEFKSLLVTEPSRSRPRSQALNGYGQGKNFKRFRKVPVPAPGGFLNIIGGSDLLAYQRGRSSELDDWLKEAAEEERQSRCEESLGENLFRYNPKPLKRK